MVRWGFASRWKGLKVRRTTVYSHDRQVVDRQQPRRVRSEGPAQSDGDVARSNKIRFIAQLMLD
jgi:hypothetical protein